MLQKLLKYFHTETMKGKFIFIGTIYILYLILYYGSSIFIDRYYITETTSNFSGLAFIVFTLVLFYLLDMLYSDRVVGKIIKIFHWNKWWRIFLLVFSLYVIYLLLFYIFILFMYYLLGPWYLMFYIYIIIPSSSLIVPHIIKKVVNINKVYLYIIHYEIIVVSFIGFILFIISGIHPEIW